MSTKKTLKSYFVIDRDNDNEHYEVAAASPEEAVRGAIEDGMIYDADVTVMEIVHAGVYRVDMRPTVTKV